jgi:hypothetical protein
MLRYNKLFSIMAFITLFCFIPLCFAEAYDFKLAALNLDLSALEKQENNLMYMQSSSTEKSGDEQILKIWKSEIKHHKKRIKIGKIMVLGAVTLNLASPFIVKATSNDNEGGEPALATFCYINLATIPVWILGLTQWIGGARKVKNLEKVGIEKGWNLSINVHGMYTQRNPNDSLKTQLIISQ